MKTYNEWMESQINFDKFVNVGETVDEEFVMYFVNILPPHWNGETYVQVGSPADSVNGLNTFTTFIKENGVWTYIGECHSGDTVHTVNTY
ncbi:hypothetical protein ABGV42_01050 [Paenibacillus pabuli]|uniref:hypothetical protein n=1 Tax=Paenibacillus pabuli TaxID=1472 RepID=UPI0032424086